MSEKLKPCPFCGDRVVFTRTEMFAGERSPSSIKCRNCNYHVSSVGPGSDDTVLAIWNTRPLEDTLRARAEQLEDARKEIQQLRNYIEKERTRHLELIVDLGEKIPRWTPVSEFLPAIEYHVTDYVLVVVYNRGRSWVEAMCFCEEWDNFKEGWYRPGANTPITETVTHWMLFPEPPLGEK